MSRASKSALYVATAAIVAPLLVTRFLPFTDLPEHVAAMATLARFGDHASTYELSFGRSQYILYHCAGAVLTRLLGDAVVANTTLLALIAIATPFSLRAALRAFGRDERLAVFGAMPFLGRPLFVGFLPYVASIPLYFFGLALVARRANDRKVSSAVALAVFSVVLFYTHASAALVFVVTAVALEIIFAARLGKSLRPQSLLWLVPTGLAGGYWWLLGSITIHGATLSEGGEIGSMSLGRALVAMPMWTFDVFVSHVDEVCAVVWWLAIAALAFLGLRERSPETTTPRNLLARIDPSYVPLACVLAAYFVLPFRVGAGGMLNVRLAPIVALSVVMCVRAPRTRSTTSVALAVAACTVLYAANAAREIRVLARHMDGFEALLATVPPHGRLAVLSYGDDRSVTHFPTYVFAGSYYRAYGGDVASYSFSELPHWPIHYRASAAPPPHSPLWVYRPSEYENTVDGAYYDYALVQGAGDPFASHRGPTFREVGRTASFVLYRKDSRLSRE